MGLAAVAHLAKADRLTMSSCRKRASRSSPSARKLRVVARVFGSGMLLTVFRRETITTLGRSFTVGWSRLEYGAAHSVTIEIGGVELASMVRAQAIMSQK